MKTNRSLKQAIRIIPLVIALSGCATIPYSKSPEPAVDEKYQNVKDIYADITLSANYLDGHGRICKTGRMGMLFLRKGISQRLSEMFVRKNTASEDEIRRFVQNADIRAVSFADRDYFTSRMGKRQIENILSYQHMDSNNAPFHPGAEGSWGKRFASVWNPYRGEPLINEQDTSYLEANLYGSLQDGSTCSEMRLLAAGYRHTGNPVFKDAFLQGLDFILRSQYPNGGWPQYYPLRGGRFNRITFNDGTMINALDMLHTVIHDDQYDFVDRSRRLKAEQALNRGINLVLQLQMKVDAQPTVWCAQYDPESLQPASARSFEPAALTSAESGSVLLFLMRIPNPAEPVRHAIINGCGWVRDNIRTEFGAASGPVWARFYEIGTNRPLFFEKDGRPVEEYDRLSAFSKTTYYWLGKWGQYVLEEFEAWKKTTL